MIVNEGELAQQAMSVVPKLWGAEFLMVNTDKYCWKILKVNPGYQCSIHAHKKKDETFVGMTGTLRLNIHNGSAAVVNVHAIHPGQSYRIQPGVLHSFQAINVTWVSEISTHHDDRDVIRLQESRRLDGLIG